MISRSGLNRFGIRAILRSLIFIIINGTILFLAAGSTKWPNAWLYIGLQLVSESTLFISLIIKNPVLLNERGKTLKEGVILFDRFFIFIYPALSFVLSLIAGFDAIRFRWLPLSDLFIIPGIILFIFSSMLSTWAVISNDYFDSVIRIQKDRGQKVCNSGPYKYIRHPGYLAGLLGVLSYPLILGSGISFTIAVIMVFLLVLRTFFEDKTLMQKLPGYRKYASKTRYLLIPYIW